MKRVTFTALFLVLFVLAACGNNEETTVKVGVSGTNNVVWDHIADKAAEEGINVEIVSFNDYVQPNIALADGELDANSFQTVAYFDEFIKERDLDLVPIATTVLAPMAIYSESITDIEELENGATVALPNDVSNQGRALLLLEEAGVITLVEDYDGLGSIEQAVVDNPKNIQFEEVAPAQIPRALGDVDAGVINNGIATDAGFNVLEDSVYHEDETATPYVNIIAVRAEDEGDETLQRLGELYQSDDVVELIEKEYNGGLIPTFIPLEDIGW